MGHLTFCLPFLPSPLLPFPHRRPARRMTCPSSLNFYKPEPTSRSLSIIVSRCIRTSVPIQKPPKFLMPIVPQCDIREKYLSFGKTVTFPAGHGEICPPHGRSAWRPADQPTTLRSPRISCMVFFKNAPSPCGSACCGLVCGSPCGSPMWGANFAMAC